MVETLEQRRNVSLHHLLVGEHRRRTLGERARQELGRLRVDRRRFVLQSLQTILLVLILKTHFLFVSVKEDK
jgi:hypothetical protein